jgi:hypothetical protein
MRLFIKKIILYLVPLFLLGVLSEYLLRNIPNDYNKKAVIYSKEAEKFQVLILGSSYGLYDLNPAYFDLYTFNGSHVLQSLDLDAKIFNKYEKRLTRLQYVIIPITFASFFFKLEISQENRLIKNYCIYYGLHSTNEPNNYFEMLNLPFSVNRTRLSDYYINHKIDVRITNLGFDSTYHSYEKNRVLGGPTAAEAIERLNIKDFGLYNGQKNYLEQIIDKCSGKNIRVLLFTPPAYKTFYSSADTLELNTSIRTCQVIQNGHSNVRYINFLDDSSFTQNDYYDISHLNALGSKKLSSKINEIIRNDSRQ